MSVGKPLPIVLLSIFGLFLIAMAGAFVSATGAFDTSAGQSPPPTNNVADVSTSTPTPLPPTPTPAPQGPPSFAQLRLWVGGDSLAAFLCENLVPDATAKGAAFADAEWKISTGLARPDYFDWMAHLDEAIAADQPNVAVFMVGANDAQGITTLDGQAVSVTPFDSDWTAAYAKRVGQAMDILSGDGRIGIWVGMPVMQDSEFAAKMQKINAIFEAEAARHPRVIYIDAWKLLSADNAFALDLPDANGTPTRMRAEDGVHLTSAGGEFLAQAVLKAIAGTMPAAPAQ